MSDELPRDSWGFSDADHAELRALMTRHRARVPELLQTITEQDGIKPEPDDPGMIGLMALIDAEVGGNTRVFPQGGLWWALLESLRALDDRKGGA